jgi:Domain of unknown function DUF29
MTTQTQPTLAELYEADETAWLDAMTALLRRGDFADLDLDNLLEYLTDMAERDRREVESRLVVLIAHVLKWVYQPDQRSRSWRGTIVEQRQELARHVGRGVLRNHAAAVLADVYREGVERAVAETDLPAEAFPPTCPYTLDELLAFDPTAE